MRFPPQADGEIDYLLVREWLATNGLGGYASGTLLGIATRRYHGLFIPNLPAPRGRTMVIPRLDEEVRSGAHAVLLGGAEFEDGHIEGDGHRFLREFRLDCLIPTWTFEIPREGAGGNHHSVLEKRIVMPHTLNTVYVEYRLISGGLMHLTLRPYVTFRMPVEYPFTLAVTRGRLEVHPFEGAPPLRLSLQPHGGVFVIDEKISRHVYYRVERERGYDHLEDLTSPGYFSVELAPGESLALVASTENWELLEHPADRILEAERQRLEKVLAMAPVEAQAGPAADLVLAADQFIILPGSRPEENVLASISGEEVRTIVAGYHWFTDWGRDTMISLEGLTLCTGRPHEARTILLTFAHYVKDGLLPNQFPEGQRIAIYNTADATLWYFHAIDRYVERTGDRDLLKVLFPILKSVIGHHIQGTHFGIGLDATDGMLKAGADGYALTWMDAKVDGWVVTPRRGKPVEIQALWYNALRLMGTWAQELGEAGHEYRQRAELVERSFNARFWDAASRHLYDVVDGEQGDDASLRPNQVFSMSLRFPILSRPLWQPVIDSIATKLLTPVGLGSLDPGHRDYKRTYFGDLRARDAAYHQGTVWAWLIGHFIDAWQRVYPDKTKAREMLRGLEDELRDAGVGSISEIFDAEPRYTPRGCIAQAWSVAEVLRALLATEERHD
ncbi:MAG: glycogen debranching protein [Nitrospirae bacterium]|nr:MAG: glycogen debranching protein [Nitrospirota bacterium]